MTEPNDECLQAQEEVVRYLMTRGQDHYSMLDCGNIR